MIPGHGSFPCPDEATFKALDLQAHITSADRKRPPGSALLSRHDTLTLPDNPPVKSGARSTMVHRFLLAGAETMNARLLESAKAWMQDPAHVSSRVSNRGAESHHSPEEAILPGSPAWCDEALSAAVQQDLATITSNECHRLTGWFNLASSPRCWNALHDHGTATWSIVYFVACRSGQGGPAEVSGSSGGADIDSGLDQMVPDGGQLSCFPGHLLLRTQLEPFTQKFAFLPISPEPGWLYIFPGHVCHAVAPSLTETTEGREGAGAFCRMTCAFNFSPC